MVELMRALHELHPAGWAMCEGSHANTLLRGEHGTPWHRAHARGLPGSTARRTPATVLRNELALRKVAHDYRVVHRSYHPVIHLLPRATAVVETLHDLSDFAEGYAAGVRGAIRRRLKWAALQRADRIVCVSHYTRNQLEALRPDLAARAIVIHHGASLLSTQPVPLAHDRPTFLFVGRRDLYKNFAILLEAMARMRLTCHLDCFGGGPFTAEETKRITTLGLAGRIRHVTGNDDRLAGHYVASVALLYPSLYEGFGLPLLEAMTLGCPVVAAPRTSLPEVGGDAALYADPLDADAWATVMDRLIEDDGLRAAHSGAGRQQAATFSWERSARAHADLYRDMGVCLP